MESGEFPFKLLFGGIRRISDHLTREVEKRNLRKEKKRKTKVKNRSMC